MAKTVVGLLDNPDEARKVIDELLRSGFRKKDIGFVVNDVPTEFKAIMKDMGKGAVLGALAGLVLAATTIVVPGFGPLLVAGPAAALTAGAVYGGLAGSIIATLTSKGVQEDHAHAYAEGVRRGGVLVTVHADTDELAERAVEIMRRHGAVKMDERVRQWKRKGWSGRFDEKAPAEGRHEPPLPEEEVLSVVEVYSMVIEMPERRRSKQPFSGQDRRQAA
jgi:hypothetical protein